MTLRLGLVGATPVLLGSAGYAQEHPATPSPATQTNANPSAALCAFLKKQSENGGEAPTLGYSAADARTDYFQICAGRKPVAIAPTKPVQAGVASAGSPASGNAVSGQSGTGVPDAATSPRHLFISRDSLSNLGEFAWPGTALPISAPLGATVNLTDDYLKGSRTFGGQAYVGTCVLCATPLNNDTSFSLGPAVVLDGNFQDPLPTKGPGPMSAVRLGPDFAWDVHEIVSTPGLHVSGFFDALPFYQTDFRGDARMYGLQLMAEPVSQELHLRAVPDQEPKLVEFFWRVIPEADLMSVQTPGQTNYVKGAYNWVGTNAQATFNFFKSMHGTAYDYLSDRISATFTYKGLVDAEDDRNTISNFQAELDYKFVSSLTPDGVPTLALVYSSGKDFMTLTKQDQLKLQLGFKY